MQSNTADNQFDKEYLEAVTKLNLALKNSEAIASEIDRKLNEAELSELITRLRELMPVAIKNLSEVYRFLNKYEGIKDLGE